MIRSRSPDVRRSLRLACVVLGLAASAAAQAQPALSERLDDSAFWNLIATLSEPGGRFADENYVSNETGLQRLLPDLQRNYAAGGVYLGVGPEQNFSYVAALEPAIAFVIDIRRQNMLEHLMYKALFELSSNRSEFLSRLFSRPEPAGMSADATAASLLRAYRVVPADASRLAQTFAAVLASLTEDHGFPLTASDRAAIAKILDAFYADGAGISYIYGETDDWHPNFVQLMDMTEASGTNWSFLGSERNYVRVRRLQLENRLVPVVGDFAGPRTLRAIGDYVRARAGTIDVFYLSNVEAYLFQNGIAAAFYDNLSTLPIDTDSVAIRTFFASTARACPHLDPALRIPFMSSIALLLADYRRGEIDSECALIGRSR